MADTPPSPTRFWEDPSPHGGEPVRLPPLERLLALELGLRRVDAEVERLRSGRHEDRSELARIGGAYEVTSEELKGLRTHVDQELAGLKAHVDERMERHDKRLEAVVEHGLGLAAHMVNLVHRLSAVEKRVLGWGGFGLVVVTILGALAERYLLPLK